jgi:hypothetical protein
MTFGRGFVFAGIQIWSGWEKLVSSILKNPAMKLHALLLFSFWILISFSGVCQNEVKPKESSKTEYVILQFKDGSFDRLNLIKESKIVNLEKVPEFSAYISESSKMAAHDQLILAGLGFLSEKQGYELVSSLAYVRGTILVKEYVMKK